jgi:hypothetical protein
MGISWAACVTGLVGLFWQLLRIERGRRNERGITSEE